MRPVELARTMRRVGQAAKTPPFHGGNTGSIPVRVTISEEADSIPLTPCGESFISIGSFFAIQTETAGFGLGNLKEA